MANAFISYSRKDTFSARKLIRTEYAQYIDPDPAAYDSQYAKYPTCTGLPTD